MMRYRGKHGRARVRTHRGRWPLALCAALVLLASVGGTLAYIAVKSERVENDFQRAYVTSEVVATDTTRAVKNTGNVDAFIRAAIVVNWMDESGNVRGLAPRESDYSMTVNSTEWTYNSSDGYYYYNYRVAPDGETEKLVTNIAANTTAPEGYSLAVEVAAEAIQADGDTDDASVPAYKDAWVTAVPDLPRAQGGSGA